MNPPGDLESVDARRAHVRDALKANGYAFLSEHLVGRSTADVVSEIGLPAALGSGKAVHALVPRMKHEAGDTSYSGKYGLGAFPLHTDLAHWHAPPRYFVLRCVSGFEEVSTLVLDGARAVRTVGSDILSRALMQPRRPLLGLRSLLRLYSPDTNCLRWDERYIVPASPAGLRGSTAFKEFLANVDPMRIPLARPGDTLVIDNWRILHGRSPVPNNFRTRVIERVYLQGVH